MTRAHQVRCAVSERYFPEQATRIHNFREVRSMTKHVAFIALAAAALAGCEQNRSVTAPAAAATSLEAQRVGRLEDGDRRGAVYTLTNQVAGNAVAVFDRAADGTLTAAATVATGGTGTGAGLGSPGAVLFGRDRRPLVTLKPRTS